MAYTLTDTLANSSKDVSHKVVVITYNGTGEKMKTLIGLLLMLLVTSSMAATKRIYINEQDVIIDVKRVQRVLMYHDGAYGLSPEGRIMICDQENLVVAMGGKTTCAKWVEIFDKRIPGYKLSGFSFVSSGLRLFYNKE